MRKQGVLGLLFFLFGAMIVSGCYDQPPAPRPMVVTPVTSPDSYGPPGSQPMPESHTQDWLRRHGLKAASSGNDCAVCHIEADCATCHIEPLAIAGSVHPPNYALLHSVEARQGLMDCTSCHRPDTFCQSCHGETRVSPRLENRPPSSFTFHPPGWLDQGAPNNHGLQARRDIHECASCHTEQDCVTCHIGINPHPPEFRFQCRTWLETDSSSCAQCHLDTSSLQGLCF